MQFFNVITDFRAAATLSALNHKCNLEFLLYLAHKHSNKKITFPNLEDCDDIIIIGLHKHKYDNEV